MTLIPPITYPVYLSVIKDRRPEQKIHDNLGKAKNAVGYTWGMDYGTGEYTVRGGQIYVMERADQDWELLYDVPRGTTADNLPWRDSK